jgi:transposase InsO family protein
VVFDHVFAAPNINVIRSHIRTSNANACAERRVRTIHQECLDQTIIVNERHLNSILHEYVDYDNSRRPHQGLGQRCPEGKLEVVVQERSVGVRCSED